MIPDECLKILDKMDRLNLSARGLLPKEKGIMDDIFAEIYKAMESLGATSDLLSIIGSYGDTLDDNEVLEYLRLWNQPYTYNKFEPSLNPEDYIPVSVP